MSGSESSRAPRRTPRQARSREKVERILRAARELLVEKGPEGFNTNAVARRAGVGIGSLYEYFPNKTAVIDRLIEDVAGEESAMVLERIAELGDASPRAALTAVVSVLLPLYVRNYPLYRGLWALSNRPREVGHRPGERQIMAAIAARLEPVADELGLDDLERTCFTVFHMVESLCEQMAAHGVSRWGQDACATEVVTAVSRYLRLAE